jgi:hypothetical protein
MWPDSRTTASIGSAPESPVPSSSAMARSILTETAGGVHVGFRHSAPREFDLVIGADGLHSNVRRLAFGPEEKFVRHLGYHAATWQLPNHLGLGPDSVGYNRPGRLTSVGGDHRDAAKAGAFFVFAAPQFTYDRHDPEQQKALIAKAFAGLGWEVPRLLDNLRQALGAVLRLDQPGGRGHLVQAADRPRGGRRLWRGHRRHGHRNRRGGRLRAGRRARPGGASRAGTGSGAGPPGSISDAAWRLLALRRVTRCARRPLSAGRRTEARGTAAWRERPGRPGSAPRSSHRTWCP